MDCKLTVYGRAERLGNEMHFAIANQDLEFLDHVTDEVKREDYRNTAKFDVQRNIRRLIERKEFLPNDGSSYIIYIKFKAGRPTWDWIMETVIDGPLNRDGIQTAENHFATILQDPEVLADNEPAQ